MAQHVRRQPARPRRQPLVDLDRQAAAQRVGAHAAAAVQVAVVPLAGQHRRVGVGPVVAELVADLGQPPVDQLVGAVDRRHQPGLGAAAAAALAEADVELAELAQVGAPVADVEHHGLVDPQPDPAPQRRREVVPGRGQVLARLRDRLAPGREQRVDLLIRRRHPDLAQRCPGLAVELVDRLLDHHAGRPADVALVAGDHELVEHRQRARPCPPGSTRCAPAGAARPGTGRRPRRSPPTADPTATERTRSRPPGSRGCARRSGRPPTSPARTGRRSPARSPGPPAHLSVPDQQRCHPAAPPDPSVTNFRARRSCVDTTAKPSVTVTDSSIQADEAANRADLHKRRSGPEFVRSNLSA